MSLIRIFSILAFVTFTTRVVGEPMDQQTAKLERVGGEYRIQSIEKQPDGMYVIIFQAVHKEGPYQTIRLEADHIHTALSKGQELKISAEVRKREHNLVDAVQVMVFLPRAGGPVPVWMMSKHVRLDRLMKPAPFLKMHNPQSDFMVL